jgi:hypothetical protein
LDSLFSQVEVPDWYTAGQLPPGQAPPGRKMLSFARDMAELQMRRAASPASSDASSSAAAAPPRLEHWDVVSGGDALADCPDTVRSLPFLHEHSRQTMEFDVS